MTPSRTSAAFLQAMLVAGVLALLTGLVLLPSFHASADAAHQSVVAIQASPAMSVLRGVHHWSSAAIIVFGGLYVFTTLFGAAYRQPGRALWLGSLALLLTGMLLQLTGHLLPFDKQAVSTASIESGIAEGAPMIGEMQAKLIRGGDAVGPATLNLWYLAHVTVLTLAFIGVAVFLTLRMRRMGVEAQRSMLIGTALILIGIGFAVAAPLGPGATAADYGSFAARPEWYILPLHSLLNIFQNIKPSLAFVGTMVIPGALGLLLATLPWIDKKLKVGKPLAVVMALGVGALFMISVGKMAPPVGTQMAATAATQGAPVKLDPAIVAKGAQLFGDQFCDGCHKVKGTGGKAGPDLTDEAARHNDIEWQILHLQSPSKVTPGSTMPSFAKLSAADQQALAQYVLSKK